jgi:hypothetical protein
MCSVDHEHTSANTVSLVAKNLALLGWEASDVATALLVLSVTEKGDASDFGDDVLWERLGGTVPLTILSVSGNNVYLQD